MTPTVPVPGGETAVIEVADCTPKLCADAAPNLTPVASPRFEPVIVTMVPPPSRPSFGSMWVTWGGTP